MNIIRDENFQYNVVGGQQLTECSDVDLLMNQGKITADKKWEIQWTLTLVLASSHHRRIQENANLF